MIRHIPVVIGVLVLLGCKTTTQTQSAVKDDNLVTEEATFRYETPPISPAHNKGPFVIDGPYDLDPAMVAERFRPRNENEEPIGDAPDVDRFGTFALCTVPGAKPAIIRDLHYQVGDNEYGIRPIPVVDRESAPWITDPNDEDNMIFDEEGPFFQYPPAPVTISGNKEVTGSEEVDKFIRKTMGWEQNDEDAPIFAFTVFTHPEEHRMSLVQMFRKSLKTENGHTHMGAYIGKGLTRNSPYLYHDQKWKVEGYPTNISVMTMEGADPWDLNMNLTVALDVLNEFNDGPVFPPDYKFDNFKGINLQEILAFYRAWIDPTWVRDPSHGKPFLEVLLEDETFFTYCAEHITMVANVGLNVHHSLEGFKAVWPDDEFPQNGKPDGEDLWTKLGERYNETFGIPVPEVGQFSPLWKKHRIRNPSKYKKFGKSMAWPPQTTSDLLANFIHNYLNISKVDPVITSGVMLMFMDTVVDRMAITPEEYVDQVLEPMFLMHKHRLTMSKYGRATGWVKLKGKLTLLQAELWGIMKGLELKWRRKYGDMTPNLKQQLLDPLMAKLKDDANVKWILDNDETPGERAYVNFREDVKKNMQEARMVQAGTGLTEEEREEIKTVMYYSPPGVIHRIISGMHPVDKFVNIRTIGTVFDHSELTYRGDRRRVVDDPEQGIKRCSLVSWNSIKELIEGSRNRAQNAVGSGGEEEAEEE